MGDNFRENIMLTIKLFDALISPILLYGSEIWGVDCNDQIEKDPAELVKFWITLTKHPKHQLSQVVYNDMKSRVNKELWSQKIKRALDQIGLGYLWTKAHENDIGILNIIKQRLKDIELQRWLSDRRKQRRKKRRQPQEQ